MIVVIGSKSASRTTLRPAGGGIRETRIPKIPRRIAASNDLRQHQQAKIPDGRNSIRRRHAQQRGPVHLWEARGAVGRTGLTARLRSGTVAHAVLSEFDEDGVAQGLPRG
jgi:hypothetical protein